MNALVTGGAGLIGSHIVDLLIDKGYDVKILDSLEKPTHMFGPPSWINKKAHFIEGDIRDETVLDNALKDVDIVFHQAAAGGFMPEINYYVDVNCTGTALMMEKIIKKHKIKKLIIASSQAVYGEGKYNSDSHGEIFPELRTISQLSKGDWEVKCPLSGANLKPLGTDENSKIQGDTVYAVSKYCQEKLVLGIGKKYDIPTVALRYSMTYGPRQSISNPYTGVMSIFSTQILNDKPPVIFEDGNQIRDMVFVEDVAKANLFVAENDEIVNDYFNVGTGKKTKIIDLANMLISAYKKNFRPNISGEFRPGEVRHLFADCSKLEKYGFKSETLLKDGILSYLNWINEQDNVKEYFSNAIDQLKKLRVVVSTK